MTNKFALVPMFGVLLLAGCGQSGQQAASSAASASTPTATESPAAPAPKPETLTADALVSGKPSGQPCSFDSDPNIVVGKQNTLRGWFLDPSRRPAGDFSFALVGKSDFAIPVKTGVTRRDVGAYLKDPALSSAGFAFTSKFESVPPGTYDVKLIVKRGPTVYVCDTGKRLTLAQ